MFFGGLRYDACVYNIYLYVVYDDVFAKEACRHLESVEGFQSCAGF